jgi:hypothetical protein
VSFEESERCFTTLEHVLRVVIDYAKRQEYLALSIGGDCKATYVVDPQCGASQCHVAYASASMMWLFSGRIKSMGRPDGLNKLRTINGKGRREESEKQLRMNPGYLMHVRCSHSLELFQVLTLY